MKLIAKQTFEQGLSKKLGGTFKVRAGAELPCEAQGDGLVAQIDGKPRQIGKALKEKLIALKMIELQD